MKNFTLPIVLGLCLVIFAGCTIFTNKGKAAKAEEKSRARIVNVEGQITANTTEKLDTIAGLAYGTDYALSKVNEPPREVQVARDMNQRVVSLAGSPSVEKMKEMQETIDKLTSMLAIERDEGKKKMDEKDLEITALQTQTKVLIAAKDSEIRKYMLLSQEMAANADAYKDALAEYQGWFGLKAVGKGLWQFIKSSMWILGIGGVLFFVLRIASASNPVCGAIFGIFEQMVSWVINAVKIVFPKALQFAGHVSSEIYNASRGILWKIIDGVQSLKEIEKRTGRDITLKELLVELEKTMDVKEKEAISQIKKELGY